MKKSQYIKQKRIQQRNLEKVTCKSLIWHIIIIIMFIALYNMPKEGTSKASESYNNKTTAPCVSNLITFKSQAEDESSKIEIDYYPELTEKESYLLAKIAMAEAEGCDNRTKMLVIMCVLNRVLSDEFPDTIKGVIFQKCNGVYQFTPVANGRWDRVEPNEDCYKAVKVVVKEAKYDCSGGATYFESCDDEDNWHSRNLEFLYESDGLRFYK